MSRGRSMPGSKRVPVGEGPPSKKALADKIQEILGASVTDEGVSSRELAEATGLSTKLVNRILRDLIERGEVVCLIGRIRDIAGRMNWCPKYKLIVNTKKKS
ncbi:MAG: winged helix-turn-helix domain-containing protein [Acidilobaceae archaeon]|nr:winged helix-turn-helix domain-containing protein [Acidilobaceae archaeon]